MMIHTYSISKSSLKRDLWEIIKRAKTPPRYTIEEIAGSKGVLSVYIVALNFSGMAFFLYTVVIPVLLADYQLHTVN